MSRKAKKSVLEVTQNPVGFTHLPSLPPELRQIIYSKMEFVERANGARTSSDMAAYFRKHRMSIPIEISLTEENGHVFIRIRFGWTYIEMHRIPDRLVKRVERDLRTNHKSCKCSFCYGKWSCYNDAVIPHISYLPFCPETIFDTFSLVDVTEFSLKSAPVGGLVDFVQPDGRLEKPVVEFCLTWHLQKRVKYVRNDPDFKKANWGKWFDFARSGSFYIDKNLRRLREEADTEFAHSEEGPVVHIHKDLYDLRAIRNAWYIRQEFANVDISLKQLMKMKTRLLLLFGTRSRSLSFSDMFEFFKSRIQKWVKNPMILFHYVFDSAEDFERRPDCDHERLLADVRDQLKPPDFLIYPGLFNNTIEGVDNSRRPRCPNDISIRCVKTGTALVVSGHRLLSGVSYDPWPEHSGL